MLKRNTSPTSNALCVILLGVFGLLMAFGPIAVLPAYAEVLATAEDSVAAEPDSELPVNSAESDNEQSTDSLDDATTDPRSSEPGMVVSDSAWELSINPQRNSTKVDFGLSDVAALIDTDVADSVVVSAKMSYGGKVTRKVEVTKKLSEIASNGGTFSVDFTTFGKFTVEIQFKKNGLTVHGQSGVTVGVTADTYNIAPVSASLPVTFFSLNLWGEGSLRSQGPTIVMFERPNAYNWDKLPAPSDSLYGVYGVPYLTESEIRQQSADFNDAGNQFRARYQLMCDYVRDLMSLDSTSHVNLYCADLYCGFVQGVIYANKIPESQYTITLLSDGSFTPVRFKQVYSKADNVAKHEQLKSAWTAAKARAYSTGKADGGLKGTGAGDYFWALVDSEPNARIWVARKDLIQSAGDGDSFGQAVRASEKFVQQNIGTLLAQNIQSSETAMAEFKALYNFSDSYFSKAQESGKDVMLLLGQRANNEQAFSDYARFVMSYYGDTYEYYYKGHPATPTDLYPDKANQLSQLGITDIDTSIAAELILFFNPDIYLSGYASSVYASVPEGMAKGMFNMTKASGLSQNDYKNMDYWMSQVGSSTDAAIRKLCKSGHANYLVEFSDSVAAREGYDISIWDATDSVMLFYRKSSGGSYKLVKTQGGTAEQSAIESGTYVIQSQLSNGMVLDVVNGSWWSGANVQLYGYNGTKAQIWRVDVDEATGLAKITNTGSGKVLDVSGGSPVSGTNVQQYDDNGTLAQRWRILSLGDGSMKVVSALDGTIVLDVSGGNSYNGSNVQVFRSNGTLSQAFTFLPVNPNVSAKGQADLKDGYYSLVPAVSGSSRLDVSSWSTANGGRMQIWSSTGRDNQIFKITKQKSGFYRIVNAWSGKALDLDGGCIIPGTRVQQWTSSSNNTNQEWAIVQGTGGSYTLQNVASGLMLDVSDGSSSNGTAVQGYFANGTQSQRWSIVAAQTEREQLDARAVASKGVVKDGVYAIYARGTARSVLDVDGDSARNGANVQLWYSTGGNAQRWVFKQDQKTGYYTIMHRGSGKVLDVSGGSTSNGANVQQYAPNGTRAQQWLIERDARGGYRITSALKNGFVLDLQGGGVSNGTNVQMYESNGTVAQSFSFVDATASVDACERGTLSEDGTFTLVPVCAPSNAVDIADGSHDAGANVQSYRSNGTNAQKFRFVWVDGYYMIVNVGSGMALDVYGGDVVAGANVAQYTRDSKNANQLFSVRKNADGTVTFVNKASGLALDVAGGSSASGVNLDAYTPNGTGAQKFWVK